ncbi:MAG: hypothetical protein LAO07_04900, partial [Acidobacteriia bacterium]|nr:hypothetical protein [Terriglobia bacterium]
CASLEAADWPCPLFEEGAGASCFEPGSCAGKIEPPKNSSAVRSDTLPAHWKFPLRKAGFIGPKQPSPLANF